jgi:hypothetical protein
MALDVYEPRGDHHSGRINPFAGWCLAQHAAWGDPDDAVPLDCNISIEPGITGAIDNASARNHDVVRFLAEACQAQSERKH